MPAPLPVDEKIRLEALREFAFLNSEPSDAFDDITKLASYICGTPTSMVSFVEEDRQWFLSRHGTELRETDRSLAFCAYAILEEGILEVPDARCDPRFADNALVTGEPHIRFYAGAPLKAPDGNILGTLCVLDSKPRTLSGDQRAALVALSRQVSRVLEGATSRRRLATALSALDAFDRVLSACVICDHLVFLDQQPSLREFVETHTLARFKDTVCRDCTPKYDVEPSVRADQFTP